MEAAAAVTPPPQESAPATLKFRRLLWWCLPALIIGFIVRVGFITAVPEAYFGSDSPSYFQTADKLWKHRHHFVLREKRRWVYPLLCTPLPALPWSPAISVSIVQHLLGLGIILGVGWIVAHYTVRPGIWVPVATFLMALDMDLLRYEHELIGDTLFLAAIIGTVALAMPLDALKDRKRLFWFLLMAAVVVAIKPHGRGFWLGCILAAMLITRNPWRWKWEAWGAIALGVVVILTSGEKRQAKWLLLNSSLPLVNLDGAKWAKYREALRPIVLKARHDYEIGQYAWTQREYKHPLGDGNPETIDPVWAELAGRKDEAEYLQVCSDLAKEAILTHPFAFAKLSLEKVGIAFAEHEREVRCDPAIFWKLQVGDDDPYWTSNPSELELFYHRDRAAFDRLVADRSGRKNYALPVVSVLQDLEYREPFAWMRARADASGRQWLTPGFLVFCAILGLGFCLRPSRFAATSLLWLPASLVMVTVFAVGDCKCQYVTPIRWAWVTVALMGLDGLLVLAASRFSKKKLAPDAALSQRDIRHS